MAAKTDGKALQKEAAKWIDRIEAAAKAEKTWLDEAAEAVCAYTGEGDKSDTGSSAVKYDFNILFSNVETIVPAIINSPPAPDIRRRFDTRDEAARQYAEILTRVIHVQVDDGRLMTELEAMAQDGFLAGRGLIRLRFKSEFKPAEDDTAELAHAEHEADGELSENAEPNDPAPETIFDERICPEVVSWRDFRHGPAKRWSDVPWMAFRLTITKDEYEDFADDDMVKPQAALDSGTAKERGDENIIWEVWDKKSREVIFIAEEGKKIIKRVPDPLGLTKFFPICDPVQAIEVTGRLMPVNPFSIYRKLAEELDTTTKRIRAITRQLKVKGWYAGDAEDLQSILDAEDLDFVPVKNEALWAAKGGIESAVAFWPVDKLVTVLRELYALRDQTKAAIYEITGISDIIRGASKTSETATAQQIKTQWGALRIQKMQRQMERAARDLFLMMAEIIPAKFSYKTLQKITGIQIVPTEEDMQPALPQIQPGMQPEQVQQAQMQAQQAEQKRQEKLTGLMQLHALMREKPSTYYRIDVETDSTVRADLTRQKAEAAEFMGAAGNYFKAVFPLVQQGVLPMNVAVEIFGSFSRLFNLGKTVGDALDELIETANKMARQPQPQQKQPSPEEQRAAAEAKAMEQEMAISAQKARDEATARKQRMQIDGQKALMDQQVKQMDIGIRRNQLAASEMDVQFRRAQLAAAGMMPIQTNPAV